MKDNIGSVDDKAEEFVHPSLKQAWLVRHMICAGSLFFADIAAFITIAVLFRSGHQVPEIVVYRGILPFQLTIDLFAIVATLFLLVRYVAGDYTKRQLFWDETRQTTVGLVVASIPFFLIRYFSQAQYSLFPDFLSWSFAIFAVPLYRHTARYLLSRISLWQVPTALIGSGEKAIEVCNTFRKLLSLGFDVRYQVDFVETDEYCKPVSDVMRIGLQNPANIAKRLSAAGCMEAIVVSDRMQDKDISELIERLMAAGIEVAVVPPLSRLPLLGLKINYFFGKDIILMHVRNNAARLPSRLIKRVIDLSGSLFLLALISPLLLVICLLIKLEGDGGGIFFVQRRVGKGAREFPCIKFRTMRADAEEILKRWQRQGSPMYAEYVASNFKLRNDPRITKIGRCLRRTSLDELPQLINVLMGDMSLVGPRPLLAREIGDYGTTISLYRQLRPGITGLWQISGRSRTTFAERAMADEWYVKNWSVWYDIVILFKTVDVLVRRDGAY